MSHTNRGSQIDIRQIESLVARHARQGASIPRGTYTGRVVQTQPGVDKWGRQVTRVVLAVADEPHAGRQISVDVRGGTARLLIKAAGSGKHVVFDVLMGRCYDGRAFSQVNHEAIRWVGSTPAEAPPGQPAHARRTGDPQHRRRTAEKEKAKQFLRQNLGVPRTQFGGDAQGTPNN